MTDKTQNVHWSFWAIAIATLIWNLMGIMSYIMQMNPDMVASMSESHRAIIEGRPIWAKAACALAVFGGVLGCILLLFRKSLAFYLLIASFVGLIIQMIPQIGMIGSTITNPVDILMMMLLPLIVAGFLIWYAKFAINKGWIN